MSTRIHTVFSKGPSDPNYSGPLFPTKGWYNVASGGTVQGPYRNAIKAVQHATAQRACVTVESTAICEIRETEES